MNEFRTEDLESLLQFFDLMLNVFFDGGIFRKTVTDVNIHERLGLANEVRATKCFLSRLYTRSKKGKRRNQLGKKTKSLLRNSFWRQAHGDCGICMRSL